MSHIPSAQGKKPEIILCNKIGKDKAIKLANINVPTKLIEIRLRLLERLTTRAIKERTNDIDNPQSKLDEVICILLTAEANNTRRKNNPKGSTARSIKPTTHRFLA